MTALIRDLVDVMTVVFMVGGVVWVIASLYMSYTYVDELLEHFKNSSAIMSRAPLVNGGPWGRLLLFGGISGIVTFPGFYIKRGGITRKEINALRVRLRRQLILNHWIAVSLVALMCITVLGIKIFK